MIETRIEPAEVNERIRSIERNFDTVEEWELDDFREFYERDVRMLLSEVERLRADNHRQRTALEEIAERARQEAAA